MTSTRSSIVVCTSAIAVAASMLGPWQRAAAEPAIAAGGFHLVLDEHMSVLEGSLGILPRRLVVLEEDFSAASRLLRNAALTDGEP